MHVHEESYLTEIELLPDGRICLFGSSVQILALLRDLGLADQGVLRRLELAESPSTAEAATAVGAQDAEVHFHE
jgi:hypothetical protein